MTSEERHEARYQRRVAKRRAKRQKKLLSYEEVFSYENLYKAYRKCRTEVSWKASTQKYIIQAPMQIYRTKEKLMKGTFKSLGFYEFDLYERGKKRHIRSVKIHERVVQRCLCDNALVPAIESNFIYDNGASIKNKGYHFSMRRLETHLHRYYRKFGSEGYILLIDFSHFFDTVSHEVVKRKVAASLTDERLIGLTNHFIDCFGDQGLGLGSQISQTLALASVDYLDHYIKEKMHFKFYGRYMDDSYIIYPSKDTLKEALREIRHICEELGVTINEKKTQIVKLTHGFTWLKSRVFLTTTGKVVRKIYKRSVTRERRKLKKLRVKYDAGIVTAADIYNAYQSWRSYALTFKAWHTVRNMDDCFTRIFIKEDMDYYVFEGGIRRSDRRRFERRYGSGLCQI